MAEPLLESFSKQPAETYPIGVEFSGQLPAGTAIASGTVAGKNMTTGLADNTILANTTATIAGTQAKVKVLGGVDGSQYKITFLVTLDDGSILEEDLLMNVKDR